MTKKIFAQPEANDTLQECAHRRKRTTTTAAALTFSAKIDSVCETEFLCTAPTHTNTHSRNSTTQKCNIKIITSFH